MEPYYFSIAITLHVLSAVIWVGGMFFAYVALRPVAASLLEPPQRLTLWSKTLMRFFIWVWLAVLIIPFTGYWMIFSGFNGFAGVAWYVHIMQALGIIMILIFLHVFFAPYMRLRKALKEENYQVASDNLGQIRRFIGINLIIGILTIITAAGLEHLPV